MNPGETDLWTLAVVLGLAAVTVVTRGFFLISDRRWRLPDWANRGLQYAPIAALSAVVLPEIISQQGEWVQTWRDARLYGAAAGIAIYLWRHSVWWTIVGGMAVYLPLRLGLGW